MIDNFLVSKQLFKWKWKDCKDKLEEINQNFEKPAEHDNEGLSELPDSKDPHRLEEIKESQENSNM